MGTTLPDGIEALRAEMELGEVMRLIERTARWVHPANFPAPAAVVSRVCRSFKEKRAQTSPDGSAVIYKRLWGRRR